MVTVAMTRSPRQDQNQTPSPASTLTFPPGTITGEHSRRTPSTPSSRNVLLDDWWLVVGKEPDGGKRLAVGGMVHTGLRVSRVFTSAPIARRIDACTLETTDGIIVVILSIINKRQTRTNGFPSEACAHFEIGFPYNWDEYASDYFATESSCKCYESATRTLSLASQSYEDSDLNYSILGILKRKLQDAFAATNAADSMQTTCSHISEADENQLHSGSIIDKCRDNQVKEKICGQYSSHTDKVSLEDHAADMVDSTERNMDGDEIGNTTKSQLVDDLAELTPRKVLLPRRSARLQKIAVTQTADTDVALLGKSFMKETENSQQDMHGNMHIMEFNEAAINMEHKASLTGQKDHKKNKKFLMEDQTAVMVCKYEANLHVCEATSTVKTEIHDELDAQREICVPRRSARLKEVDKSALNSAEVKTESYSKSKAKVQSGIVREGKSCEKRVKQDPKKCFIRSLASPEVLHLKRSRSGRVLVPTLDVSQNIAYDMNGTIVGVITTTYDRKMDRPLCNPKEQS